MKNHIDLIETNNELLGCFGDYVKGHSLCSHHCVLRLRCAIKQNWQMRMELSDDWSMFEESGIKFQ
jgi:hypothetical protein